MKSQYAIRNTQNAARNTQSAKGFTMVELLVVLVIVGILAAVATPLYLANTRRARASEAVATMGLVRQALRDYNVAHPNSYQNIANITLQPPTGAGVDVGVAQYFSNAVFSVGANVTSSNFANPPAQDFLIFANGNTPPNVACSGNLTNCAVHNTEVSGYHLEMDNSGRIFVSYDGNITWSAW